MYLCLPLFYFQSNLNFILNLVFLSENPAYNYLKAKDILGIEITFDISEMDKNGADQARWCAARFLSSIL
jgi:hypothetical protein